MKLREKQHYAYPIKNKKGDVDFTPHLIYNYLLVLSNV